MATLTAYAKEKHNARKMRNYYANREVKQDGVTYRNWGRYNREVIEMMKASIANMGQQFDEVLAHKDKYETSTSLVSLIGTASYLR